MIYVFILRHGSGTFEAEYKPSSAVIDLGVNGNAEFAGVDNAGVDISARYGKGGHCGSGQISTI